MTAIFATVVLTHFLALAAVFWMARHSVILVDEDGRPIARAPWKERVVPTSELPAPSAKI